MNTSIVDAFEELDSSVNDLGSVRKVSGAFSDSNTDSARKTSLDYQLGDISKLISSVADTVSDVATLSQQLTMAGKNIYNAFTDSSQYEELLNAAANAGTSYINSKVSRIKNLWSAKVSISIGSLLGEVAPYAMNLKTLGGDLESRLSKVMGYLAGTGTGSNTLKDVLKSIGDDALDALENDSALNSALNGLSIVQAYSSTFNAISTVVDIIKKLKNISELAAPIKSMATNLAEVWCTDGVSAVEMQNTASEEMQKGVSNAEVIALYIIKKVVFPMKIKLPALLVGAVDSISVRSAMLELPEKYSWLSSLFNDEFFNNVEYTLKWSDAISNAVSSVQNAVRSVNDMTNDWSTFTFKDKNGNVVVTPTGKAVNRGDYMKSLFMESMTYNYMQSAVEEARKRAYLSDYSTINWINRSSSLQMTIKKSDQSVSFPTDLNSLDSVLADSSEENPITSIQSLMNISKILYDNII